MLVFQFLYETPIYKGENPDCCKQLAYPCRRHCLKTVKIEDAGRFADKKELEKYFSENAKNMKSFQYSWCRTTFTHIFVVFRKEKNNKEHIGLPGWCMPFWGDFCSVSNSESLEGQERFCHYHCWMSTILGFYLYLIFFFHL
jgi:hypothetical protein